MKTYADGEVRVTEQEAHCEKHGPYISKIRKFGASTWGGGCDKCVEEQSREADEYDARLAYSQREMVANLPGKFASANVPVGDMPAGIAAWAANVCAKSSPGALLLTGPVGTGKTHIGVSLLRHFMRKGFYGKYLSAIEYGRRVRESWSKRTDETEQALLETYSKAGILILDEIGANRSADESMIQDLICARYDAGGMPRTVIITNLAASALEKALGERATDRIREGATLLSIAGESRRRPAA